MKVLYFLIVYTLALLLIAGCSNVEDELKESGFQSVEERERLRALGFNKFQEFLDSNGQITAKYFKENCDSGDSSFYKNKCFGKQVIWYAIVGNHSSDGVGLSVADNCSAESEFTVDAKNLSSDFSVKHKSQCVKLYASVKDQNIFTPDILVHRALWIESSEEKNKGCRKTI